MQPHAIGECSREAWDAVSAGKEFLMNRIVLLSSTVLAIFLGGCSQTDHKDHMEGMQMGTSSARRSPPDASAVDLHNTVCP